MPLLEKKIALVTGASQGLGEAIALAMAREGAKVFCAARSSQKLQETVEKIQNAGGDGAYFAVDLRKYAEISQLAKAIIAKFGGIDILVNCAGVFIWKDFLELTEEDWQMTLDTNLKAAFLLTQALTPQFVKQNRGGAILNISSIHGTIGDAKTVPHCAAKFGLEGLTRAAAAALRPHNIRVNALAPGAIEAKSAEKTSQSLDEKVTQKDLAQMAVFLASDQAGAITGTTLEAFGNTRKVIKA